MGEDRIKERIRPPKACNSIRVKQIRRFFFERDFRSVDQN